MRGQTGEGVREGRVYLSPLGCRLVAAGPIIGGQGKAIPKKNEEKKVDLRPILKQGWVVK